MEKLDLGIDGLDDIEQIGAGGASRVYRAKQVELDRLVALKVLKASDDPEVTRRFDRERKAMGRLSLNEGIVPVYSSGVTERGEPYLIMPYYPNGSLQDRMRAGPVPWKEAVGYVAAATETMAAAHEASVVHLDLKPANVLLASDGSPRIADFGIAKLVGDQTVPDTGSNAFTPTFSAPETLLGGQASPASDVYGLAATLWALIAGQPPFRTANADDNTLMAVVGRVVHQPPGDLRHLAPDPICSVIEIAMAKDASDRYPTAGAFRQALANAVRTVDPPPVPPPIISRSSGDSGAAETAATAGSAGPTGGHDPAGANRAGTAQSNLRFEAAVPPRLVPASTSRRAGIADAVDRYSGVAVGLGVAGLVLAAVFVGQRLLPDAGIASGGSDQLLETDRTTPSTIRSADAGAGSGGSDPAGATVTSSTTESSTTSEAGPGTTAPTSVNTVASSGSTTTGATTTSTDPSTTTDPSSTTSSDTTVSSSSTTETTTTSSSSSTSSSTSSSSTSSSTSTVPTLAPPTGLVGEYRAGLIILAWVAPGDTDGLQGYTIFRDGAPVGSVGPGITRFVDRQLPDLSPGTAYVYQVRSDGPPSGNPASSALSNAVSVTIIGDDDLDQN